MLRFCFLSLAGLAGCVVLTFTLPFVACKKRLSAAYTGEASLIVKKAEALDTKVNSRAPTREWSPDLIDLKIELERFLSEHPTDQLPPLQFLFRELLTDFELVFELERFSELDSQKPLMSGSELGRRLLERYPALQSAPQLQDGQIAVAPATQVIRSTAYLRVEKLRALTEGTPSEMPAK